MKSVKKILSVALLSSLALGSAAAADDYLPFRIRLPAEFDAGRALLLVGQYGNGLALEPARREADSNDFTCRIAPTTTSVKLLIYYPGCRLLTAEIPHAKLSEPFTAVLQKLPAVPLTIQLTRSDGTPLSGQSVALRQSLLEMEYFGYADGMVSWPHASPVASGTTDASGRVALEVPLLLDDPLFPDLKVEPEFHVTLGSNQPYGPRDYDLVPAQIPSQKRYANPLAVMQVFRGSISGKVERSFLISHGADVPTGPDTNQAYRVSFNYGQVGSRVSSGTGLKADGSFSEPLPAGTYDFRILVVNGAGRSARRLWIPVGTNVVVGEHEHRQLVLK